MIYIKNTLIESLTKVDKKSGPSGFNSKDVFVISGGKIVKYAPGSFSLLTLMALTACGGGGGGSGATTGGGGSVGGMGLKGPIQGAVAFVDTNNNKNWIWV